MRDFFKKKIWFMAVLLAGCAPRWGRHPSQRVPEDQSAFEIRVSSAARAALPALPVLTPEERAQVLYYSDLGPRDIDVGGYPAQQRYNYGVYSRVCSRCHGLARSINAPVASRGFWEMYLLGMRAINRLEKKPGLSAEERNALLDFLEYDSKVRKIEHRREFEALTEALKARYEPILRERVRSLQESKQPVLLRRTP